MSQVQVKYNIFKNLPKMLRCFRREAVVSFKNIQVPNSEKLDVMFVWPHQTGIFSHFSDYFSHFSAFQLTNSRVYYFTAKLKMNVLEVGQAFDQRRSSSSSSRRAFKYQSKDIQLMLIWV